MKRLVAGILVLLCVALSGCKDCAMQYEYATMGNFSIGVNKLGNVCFVGPYKPPLNEEGNVIAIPNDYNGIPITRIGGYTGLGVPTPFTIDLSVHYPAESEDKPNCYHGNLEEFQLDFAYNVVEVEFVLQIGEYVEEIVFVIMDCYYLMQEDGESVFYHPVVYIECAENNPYFYSKDGKLYDKDTDALVTEFAYKSE